ncbi:hypothetical protein AMTRI_Chr13g116620 [Amborella trichopoda]|uniref:Uncharacterized protein n=1 Tax=Amborella trichopoda TaxID=13333 RepID=W1NZL6_AMBTC|nr:hypothetical protein AMTR_s00106p00119030 [Amborella trichopoda]
MGFWSSEIGFWRKEKDGLRIKNSVSMDALKQVIFAGGASTVSPKGWVLPSDGEKKLRIGVPVRKGFKQLVEVKFNGTRNETEVTGFCIDVFDGVLLRLPHALPYEFIPFEGRPLQRFGIPSIP